MDTALPTYITPSLITTSPFVFVNRPQCLRRKTLHPNGIRIHISRPQSQPHAHPPQGLRTKAQHTNGIRILISRFESQAHAHPPTAFPQAGLHQQCRRSSRTTLIHHQHFMFTSRPSAQIPLPHLSISADLSPSAPTFLASHRTLPATPPHHASSGRYLEHTSDRAKTRMRCSAVTTSTNPESTDSGRSAARISMTTTHALARLGGKCDQQDKETPLP